MKITIIIIFSLWCALVIFFSFMKKRKENARSNQLQLLESSNQRVSQ
jgi:preprotein translocase subunit SecG